MYFLKTGNFREILTHTGKMNVTFQETKTFPMKLITVYHIQRK